MQTQMIIRITPELKNHVGRLAKSEGKTVSLVIRELLENYVKEHDMAAYIDDLWARIHAELHDKGIQAQDVERVIQEVRTAGK